jgi:hypothetical protein
MIIKKYIIKSIVYEINNKIVIEKEYYMNNKINVECM